MHVMIAKWAPPNERSILASIVYAGELLSSELHFRFSSKSAQHLLLYIGTALGTVISILLTGILASNLEWMWIFYIEGALCLIWCTAWWVMIEDSPEEQLKFISQDEKDYIMRSLGHSANTKHGEVR